MKKNQIKEIAKIWAANIVRNSLGTGACSEYMTLEEHERFQDEVYKIADKISNKEFAELDQIVLSTINKQTNNKH